MNAVQPVTHILFSDVALMLLLQLSFLQCKSEIIKLKVCTLHTYSEYTTMIREIESGEKKMGCNFWDSSIWYMECLLLFKCNFKQSSTANWDVKKRILLAWFFFLVRLLFCAEVVVVISKDYFYSSGSRCLNFVGKKFELLHVWIILLQGFLWFYLHLFWGIVVLSESYSPNYFFLGGFRAYCIWCIFTIFICR